MENFYMVLLFIISYLPTMVLLAFTPYYIRKSENFGIGTPEEIHDREDLKALRKQYRNRTLFTGTVLGLLIFISFLYCNINLAVFVYIGGLLLMILISFIFYLSGHSRVKMIKQSEGWSDDKIQITYVDTDFRKTRSSVSPLWFLLYPLIIVGTVLTGFLVYDKLPQRIPVHFDAAGIANGWAEKSVKILFTMPVVQVFISLVMSFAFWIIIKSRQQIEAANPKVSLEQNRKFRYYWSAFILFSGAAILVMFAFIHMSMLGIINPALILPVTLVIPAGMIVSAIILSLKVGQGGSRLTKVEAVSQDSEGKVANRDDDRYWKLGMLYYNPQDPTLFVEKRFGVGWTFNFARPAAWVILAGLVVVLPAAIIITTTWLVK